MPIRTRRVGNQIQKLISELIDAGAIRDPRVAGLISITGVDVTADLRSAKVYYSCFGSKEELESTAKALESARGYIQSEVGTRLGIKFTPVLSFVFDSSIAYGDYIERILGDIPDED